jgi:hypothetical protein
VGPLGVTNNFNNVNHSVLSANGMNHKYPKLAAKHPLAFIPPINPSKAATPTSNSVKHSSKPSIINSYTNSNGNLEDIIEIGNSEYRERYLY